MAVAAVLAVGVVGSCGGGAGDLLLGYYVYDRFIDKDNNNRIWTGEVRTATGQTLADYLVTITAQRPAPLDDESRSDLTDENGIYRLSMPWYEVATYRIEVSSEGTTVYQDDVGPVADSDQSRNIVVTETVSATISGVVKDSGGLPTDRVMVAIARALTIGGEPDALLTDSDGAIRYQITNVSGVFLFESVLGRPLLLIGFNPDYGFGYYLIEDPALASGGDLTMPSGSSVAVDVRVLNSAGEPVADSVLPVAQRFTLRLEPAFNLSSQVAALVSQEGLFGGLTAAEVTATHPVADSMEVLSTGSDGIADQSLAMKSGLYRLSLEDTAGNPFDGVLVGAAIRLIDNGSSTIEVKLPSA